MVVNGEDCKMTRERTEGASLQLKAGFAGPKNWPCCGVSAVATVCEVPFSLVLDYMRKRWGLTEAWKGSTNDFQRNDALTHFGCEFVETKIRPFKRDKRLKFWKWALLHAKPDTTYIVNIPGHVVVFRNNMIVDQNFSTPTYFPHSDRIGNSCVNAVCEIISIPSAESREQAKISAANELSNLF